jgi:hypothetical protein
MRKLILLSIVLVPLWLALRAAADPRPQRGLKRLLLRVALLDALYVVLLYYVYLKLP